MNLKEILDTARENNIPCVEVNGIKYHLPANPTKPVEMSEEEIKKMYPTNALDQLSDEEILFWSVPYGSELENKKLQREEQLKHEKEFHGED